MLLLGSFFGCRLIWGTYQSLRVYQDVWHVIHLDMNAPLTQGHNVTNPAAAIFASRNGQLCLGNTACIADQVEVMKFAKHETSEIPLWLICIYLATNLTLNSLNFYWFGKMIETVRKRFEGAPHDEFKHEKDSRRPSLVEEAATRLDREVLSGPETPAVEIKDPITGASMTTGVARTDGGIVHKR